MSLASSHPWRVSLAIAAAVAVLGVLAACSSEGVIGSLARGSPEAGEDAEGSVEPVEAGVAEPLGLPTTAIAAGGESTCVKTASSEVRCWGENASGSLGIGSTDPSSSAAPVTPTPLGKVQALAAGERAQCALTPAGKVFCWGDMFVGDFNGLTIDHLPVTSPLEQVGVGEVARIAVGRYFSCLLGSSGDVRCFGLNDHGQLGVGSTERKYLPTTVAGFDGPVTSISASMGGLFVCATTHPGSVYCWGDNTNGQLLPDKGVVMSPQRVALSERALEVASGGSHACARLVTGSVKCWGAGGLGQLGNGATASSTTPVEVLYLTDVVTLATGLAHTCAVRREGTVFCWGDAADGQAGRQADPSRPLLVRPASFGAQFVSCGLKHSCAWGTGGHVECWGSDASLQLGPGKATF